MKRFIIIIPLIFFLLVSCQQNIEPDHAEIPVDEVLTRALSTGKVGPDDPIVFLPATNMKAWTDIGPLEERFAASEVPASRLSSMTTEALVKSMMNYPLNYLVFAYNDPKMAIDIIVKHSPLHKEFLSRPDAAEVFVDMYAAAELDMSLEKSNFDGDYSSLSYANMMFMEYFWGTKVLTSQGKASIKQKLADSVARKLKNRLQDTVTFSHLSVNPLITIDEVEALGVSQSLSIDNRSGTEVTTIYTILEKPIDAFIYDEMSNREMEIITNDFVTQYPDAIVRGSATRKYNSHSYAWYESSLDNHFWIEYYDSDNNPQLSKFWTNDAYVECSGAETEVVYISDFDHSAVKLSNGNYLSKWHLGPLMEHAPSYSPYSSTNRRYFKFNFTSRTGGLTILGDTRVITNQTNLYSIDDTDKPYLTYDWEVLFMNAPAPTPFILSIGGLRGKLCYLTCQDYGLYKVKVYAYNRGYQIASGELDVISAPYW